MSIVALLVLAQAPPAAVPPPQRIDLIAAQCPRAADGEAVVCGKADGARLPLPDERGPPDHPVPGNPALTGTGALANVEPPCATLQGGCQVGLDIVGMGTAAIRLVGKAINPSSCCEEPGQSTNPVMLLRDAAGIFRKKPDKANRVAIDLDAPPPSLAGRLSP